MAWWRWNQRGCDTAKEGTKSGGVETLAATAKSVDDAMFIEIDKKMDKILEIQRENLELKKAELDMKKQMFDMDTVLKENEIMKVGLFEKGMSVGRLKYFQALQKNITEKYEAKR